MNNMLKSLEKDRCTACGACANICPTDAIKLKADEFGFNYPNINEVLCIDCGKCISVCKAIKESNLNIPIKAFAATHKNKNTLISSSSGGVFSALAEYVLENGGAVCGCIFDEKLTPIHICTEKIEEYLQMRKSKYVQSNIGLIYREIKDRLTNKQLVLFSGTPCQIEGLYSFLGVNTGNLLTVDLVCHGVPSELMFKKFINYLEKKHKTKIKAFDFRSKKYGWQRFTMEYTDINKKVINLGKANEFYFPAFSTGNIMRPSCFSCKFACEKRVADITIGDFWGYEKLNLSCDTTNGTSLCTFNTPASLKLISTISKYLFLEEIDYNVAVNGNTCLRHPTVKGDKWDEYMLAIKNDEIPKIAQKYLKTNKKRIIRGKIKLMIPIKIFKYIRRHN